MILMTKKLKIGLITGHIPVAKIAESITPELIQEKVEILTDSLIKTEAKFGPLNFHLLLGKKSKFIEFF